MLDEDLKQITYYNPSIFRSTFASHEINITLISSNNNIDTTKALTDYFFFNRYRQY